MKAVKNLEVNEKKIKQKKNLKYKLVALTLSAVAMFSVVGVNAYIEKNDNENISITTEYYGEESIQKEILDYIDVSERLHDLKLENYDFNEDLYSVHNISNELKSVDEINMLVEKFEKMYPFVSTKNVDVQSENVLTVLNLIKQQELVNNYIYKTGYKISNKEVTQKLKAYTSELYGIPQDTIYFEKHSSGESVVYVLITKDKYGIDKKYPINGFSEPEKIVKKGIDYMIKTQTHDDPDNYDNNTYNSARNARIRNTIIYTANISKENDQNNLYNEKLSNKLK